LLKSADNTDNTGSTGSTEIREDINQSQDSPDRVMDQIRSDQIAADESD